MDVRTLTDSNGDAFSPKVSSDSVYMSSSSYTLSHRIKSFYSHVEYYEVGYLPWICIGQLDMNSTTEGLANSQSVFRLAINSGWNNNILQNQFVNLMVHCADQSANSGRYAAATYTLDNVYAKDEVKVKIQAVSNLVIRIWVYVPNQWIVINTNIETYGTFTPYDNYSKVYQQAEPTSNIQACVRTNERLPLNNEYQSAITTRKSTWSGPGEIASKDGLYVFRQGWSQSGESDTADMGIKICDNLTCNLYIDGDYYTLQGYYGSGYYVNSSRTVKENIAPTSISGEELINSVNVVDFNYISDEKHYPKVGFIAEDTDPLLSTPEQKTMDQSNCIGVMMKAIQELSAKVRTLTNKLESLTPPILRLLIPKKSPSRFINSKLILKEVA